jgi:lysozyme
MPILGTDISTWDGNWDVKKAKAAGDRFVYIRCSVGLRKDNQVNASIAKAKAEGFPFGLFHYITWDVPALEQARLFVAAANGSWGQLPPVLDYEERNQDLLGIDHVPSDAIGRLWNMTQVVTPAYGKPCWIYTSPDYWKCYGSPNAGWKQFGLWIAHWGVTSPIVPLPWTSYSMWQTTAKGPGLLHGSEAKEIDLDQVPMTETEWLAFLGNPIPPPALTLEERVRRLEVLHNL